MPDAIIVDSVTKAFGANVAVNDVSFRVPAGCVCGFLGPNGAGKTTLIRMILGILYPDSGAVGVLGHATAESARSRIGYLPEERGLYPKMRAVEYLAYVGALKGLSRTDASDRARSLMAEFGLAEAERRKCQALSKGMAQKLQILATFIHDPELVILDEPFSGLDPVNVDLVRDAVLRMKRDGKTVIFSTHMMDQAEQLCDRIMLVHEGRKVLDGSLTEVREAQDHVILVDYDGDGATLQDLPGVSGVHDAGKRAELTLTDTADPQAILHQLIARVEVESFAVRRPSLHEVFVRTVGGQDDA
ncbi:ATP-binding cassette domain-containing protein [Candidatus Poribacteria bacterium]|jgi:ABC-2 type transport system ATP-binding protein|nr:ATP-binding cassette domain-containing protein [Candidatus Poribacteria bacterium]MBT5533833.1 ATP-binding cassette domain-containing protein [Candidatus Poribacteria bacterium]MBT5710451.1 ATP-binding cassette domain-containing protein [Candidatus Poribacteria bacterium]MBT7097353.1 ATP-binding cassette domain-containing protein [Candidatus Poribacteria bacterium]MBT7807432.1 ATP-binding cassette domain-containing protein [Candidatus Poribacteria bacterium]